jgi:hypothetical protein
MHCTCLGRADEAPRIHAIRGATSREAAVTYKRELDKLNAPKSKIIMTSHLGEKGKDGTNWDEYFLTSDQREEEANSSNLQTIQIKFSL